MELFVVSTSGAANRLDMLSVSHTVTLFAKMLKAGKHKTISERIYACSNTAMYKHVSGLQDKIATNSCQLEDNTVVNLCWFICRWWCGRFLFFQWEVRAYKNNSATCLIAQHVSQVIGDIWFAELQLRHQKRMSALFFFPRHIWSVGRIHFISSLIKLILSREEEQQLKCFVLSQERRPDEAWTAMPDGRWRRCRMRTTGWWWCVCLFMCMRKTERNTKQRLKWEVLLRLIF